jgi:DNA-directed RNA polymerase specialized sigma24 family protein
VSGSPQRTDDPAAKGLLRRLDAVCARLTKAEGQVATASTERNDLFRQLLDEHGVTQREIADRAQISEPAVAKAARKARAAAEG